MKPGKRFSPYFYNSITYFGVFLAILIFVIECFLFAVDFFSHQHIYLAIFTYVMLPPFLILGLLLIPAGALWKRRRVQKGTSTMEPRKFHIDPTLSTHRNAILVFLIGTFLFLIMSFIGAYKSFQYTESVQFCGALCHNVMNPEYTAYLKSPHGRVKCVECHIGAGADWYVRSKLSGTRQVFKALTNSFEKPIKTPVANLRPAEETCKQCHWPGKYFSTLDYRRTYFLTEGDNPEWQIRMLLNVGGGGHQSYGVHAHMNVVRDIYYAAEDARRQKITWIKSVGLDGKPEIYTTPGSKWKDSQPPAAAIRKMDCIDCHNRPTHQFLPPYRLVNEAMQFGNITATIPGIKEQAMEALSKKYKTLPEAKKSIEDTLTQFYKTKHADYYSAHQRSIEGAIHVIQSLYEQNMFPEMKTRWDTHPDNIGHLASPGCFRCHDGEHKTAENKLIANDCKSCHLIVEQGAPGKLEKNIEGLEFKHPVDIGDDWKTSSCNDCHSGGA